MQIICLLWLIWQWMKDNKEYSTEKEVKLTIDGATELTAVFE